MLSRFPFLLPIGFAVLVFGVLVVLGASLGLSAGGALVALLAGSWLALQRPAYDSSAPAAPTIPPPAPPATRSRWRGTTDGTEQPAPQAPPHAKKVEPEPEQPKGGTPPVPQAEPPPAPAPAAPASQAEPAPSGPAAAAPPPVEEAEKAEPPTEEEPELEEAKEEMAGAEGAEAVEDTVLSDAELQDQTVHFAAYYPKEVEPNQWQPLHAYIYRQYVEQAVLKDAEQQLGERMSDFRRSGEPARQAIAEGAAITATPHLPGFQFNPPMLMIGFYKPWHRLDFELRAVDAPLNQATNGRLTFSVEGVIVADIPLSVYVGEKVETAQTVHHIQKIYEAIFASYSHRDTPIVERVEKACQALGLDYLRDVTALRSGQHWSDELLAMIDRADIFQLFWSPHAAQSEYVRNEWMHALQLGRDDDSFIRPVYWIQPMPDPPAELSHLHFAYQPGLSE